MEKVSVVILAYNQLPYTRLCIDSLYIYSSHIGFELITVNNGSTDGTREYFDSLPNEKKINFDENVGIEKAINAALDIAEGEYFALVNNDIILTENWLDNLIKVLESDPKIGAVVPTCNATLNDQLTCAKYYNTTELQEFASSFNKSNFRKWEERLTLTMYLVLFRTIELKELGGLDLAYCPAGFDDDDLSFRYRRSGYKIIYTSDTYVHHYSGMTLRDTYSNTTHMNKNLQYFISKFGVNVYDVIAIDYRVLNNLNYSKPGNINILAIGKSCGNTILRVKDNFKKSESVYDIKLSYYSLSDKYLIDLSTICEKVYSNSLENIGIELKDEKFDCIHIEEKIESTDKLSALLKTLFVNLKDDGEIIFFLPSTQNDSSTIDNENLDKLITQSGYSIILNRIEGPDYMYILTKSPN